MTMEKLSPAQRFRVREQAMRNGYSELDWLTARAMARASLLSWIGSQLGQGHQLRRVDLARAASSAAAQVLRELEVLEGPLGTDWRP